MTAYAVIRAQEPRPPKMGKIRISPDGACAEAERHVTSAGFVFDRASSLSEARYFRFAGRVGLLRIATHRKGSRNTGLGGPVLASITFSHRAAQADGFLTMSPIYIEWQTAAAIGIFMIRAERANS